MPKPEKRPSRFSALLLWMIAALGLVLTTLLAALFAPALENLNFQVQQLIIDLVYYLPCLALPLFWIARKTPGLYEAYRPNPISLFNVISIAVLAVLGVFFVNDIIVLWSIPFQKLGLDIFSGSIPAPANTRELAMSIFSMAVIPAVCEEFLFRGAIMSAFEKNGSKHAFVISALLFSVVHASLIGLPAQFLLGLILAMLVFWTDSIYAGLVYHTVHNSTLMIIEYMQAQLPADPNASADLLTAIGGFAGIAELALSIVISGALILISLRMFRLRGALRGVYLEERRKKKLIGKEIAVLITGIAVIVLMYAMDIISMLGGAAA